MEFKLMHIVVIALCLGLAGMVVHNYTRSGMRFLNALFWLVVWVGIALLTAFPSLMDLLQDLFAVKHRRTLVMVTAIIVLSLMVFKLTMKLDRLNMKLRRLAQELSLLRSGQWGELNDKETTKPSEDSQ